MPEQAKGLTAELFELKERVDRLERIAQLLIHPDQADFRLELKDQGYNMPSVEWK